MEDRRDRCRGGNCLAEGDTGVLLREVPKVRALESRVLVDVDRRSVGARWLAHAHGLEAPAVPCVQGCRIDEQDRHSSSPRRVVHVGVEGARCAGRLDLELSQLDRIQARLVPGRPQEELVVELADAIASRKVEPRHAEVLAQVGEGQGADVLLDRRQKCRLDHAHELDVVLAGDLAVRLPLEQPLDVQVVESADDGAT